jgi:hypothetical protein
MAEEFRSEAGFRISPVDPRGRKIEPAVLDAAEAIGQRAVHYAEKLVGDPALATNLLEESAAAVSRVLRNQQAHNDVPLHDLRAYLFQYLLGKGIHASAALTASHGSEDRDPGEKTTLRL